MNTETAVRYRGIGGRDRLCGRVGLIHYDLATFADCTELDAEETETPPHASARRTSIFRRLGWVASWGSKREPQNLLNWNHEDYSAFASDPAFFLDI